MFDRTEITSFVVVETNTLRMNGNKPFAKICVPRITARDAGNQVYCESIELIVSIKKRLFSVSVDLCSFAIFMSFFHIFIRRLLMYGLFIMLISTCVILCRSVCTRNNYFFLIQMLE